MKSSELKTDSFIKAWVSDRKENTKEIYIDSMRAYTEFLNKTPQELIEEAEDEIINGLLMRKRAINTDLRRFREHLEECGNAPMSVKGRVTAVRSFYKFNNIQLPVLPKTTPPSPQIKHKEVPRKEDIQDVINIADPLEKAIVLVGACSGLAINEISNLLMSDFTKGYDPKTEITTFHLIRGKNGYEFYTFLTPECSRAVLEYIKIRTHTSDTKDPQRQEHIEKQKILYDSKGNPLGYLFIGRYISKDFLTTFNEEDRKLEPCAIKKIYRELNERTSKANPKGEWNVFRSHNMRKYFYNVFLSNHAEIFLTEFLMGHKLDSTKDAYYRANPMSLREDYQLYIPYLTIQKQLDISESPEYIKMKTDNEVLIREIARTTVDNDYLVRMKTDYDQKMIDLEKSVKHQLQLELRAYDKMKVASTGIMKEHYAQKAQKIRDKLKK